MKPAYCQNWRHDVVAIVTASGAMAEQVRYSAYGVPFGIPQGDVNGDGTVDNDDRALINAAMDESVGDPGYDVRADLTLTGTVTSTDLNIWSANNCATLGWDALSEDPDDGVGNRIGYAGYQHDPALAASWTLYHVRNRVYNADLGRWTRRDPLGYVDGMSLYEYVGSSPAFRLDPFGRMQSDPKWWSRPDDDTPRDRTFENAIIGAQVEVERECDDGLACDECWGSVHLSLRLMFVLRSATPGSTPHEIPDWGPGGQPTLEPRWPDEGDGLPFPWPNDLGPEPNGLPTPILPNEAITPYWQIRIPLGSLDCKGGSAEHSLSFHHSTRNPEDDRRGFSIHVSVVVTFCGNVWSHIDLKQQDDGMPPLRQYPENPYPVWPDWPRDIIPPYGPSGPNSN